MESYESILKIVSGLSTSASADKRHVTWLTPGAVVGLAKTFDGRIEIFLAGQALRPKSRVVRRALEHQTWHRSGGQPKLDANRLLLPAAGHFGQVAAFVCAEILRCGAEGDLVKAFKECEPIIELTIAKLRLTDQALLGLTGELFLLDALLRNADDHAIGEIVGAWDGWRESTRDIALDAVGIEIKTTTLSTSSHRVQGVHQVEILDGADDGKLETGLFLVSIGLQWVQPDTDNSHFTLPRIVDSILARIRNALETRFAEAAIEVFLSHVAQYGDEQNVGYVHQTMSKNPIFARPFISRFVRCYDMTDPDISVLRSADVNLHDHVEPGSVTFRITLPLVVQGDLNPTVGLNTVAKLLLAQSAIT